MWWEFGIIGGGVLLVGGAGVWILAPALRSMFRSDFEPTYTDDEAVFQVQQKYIPGAGS